MQSKNIAEIEHEIQDNCKIEIGAKEAISSAVPSLAATRKKLFLCLDLFQIVQAALSVSAHSSYKGSVWFHFPDCNNYGM